MTTNVFDLLSALTTKPYIFAMHVPLVPQPKDRPRFLDGHTTTSRRTRAYEDILRDYTMTVPTPTIPVTCPLAAAFVFTGAHHQCDWDNLAKAAMDALQGIVFKNDRQIRRATVLLAEGDEPTVSIALAPLP